MRSLLAGLVLVLLSLTPLTAADAPKGFKTRDLNIGYMPQKDMGERVAVEDLGKYFKSIEAICAEFFADVTTPENFTVVVVVKPGNRAKIWFISSRQPNAAEHRDDLHQRLEAVPAPVVRGGPIAFALRGKLAGGVAQEGNKDRPPIPAEWQQVIDKLTGPADFDDLLPRIWPDAPGEAAKAAMVVPEGFENQTLDPLGGHILRPKDWFYTENHHGKVYMWTISREDSSKGAYTTGMRLQTFVGVKEGTGKDARQFLLDFIESKKKTADRVLETCEEKKQGMFTRICLQTEEGPYHILYSLFWTTEGRDMAVITISGTTKELWPTYAPIFDQMSAFVLIDPEKIKK
jgi:hypothetical protein